MSNKNKITGFEISFRNQNPNLAPFLEQRDDPDLRFQITGRDMLLPFVKFQIEEAFDYLQCYFNIEIVSEKTKAEYIAESEEEKEKIKITNFETNREIIIPFIPFNMFTRAIMAAETVPSPRFEANFLRMARMELSQERYIDSFRYSFMLIESIYGNGKFKTAQLKSTLKKNTDFVSIVSTAIKERTKPKKHIVSDTEKLLSDNASVDSIIDHIVDRRGFYFHGNIKNKDSWRPHNQEEAESLCLLSLNVAGQIAINAAQPMFNKVLSERHRQSAELAGAIMAVQVNYKFQELGYDFDREEEMQISVPGTKATPKLATYLVDHFLKHFQENFPNSDLKSATCIVSDSGQKVFSLRIDV